MQVSNPRFYNDVKDLGFLFQKYLNKHVVITEGTHKETRKVEGELIDLIGDGTTPRKLVIKDKVSKHYVAYTIEYTSLCSKC